MSNVEKSITRQSGGLSIFLTGENKYTPRWEHTSSLLLFPLETKVFEGVFEFKPKNAKVSYPKIQSLQKH